MIRDQRRARYGPSGASAVGRDPASRANKRYGRSVPQGTTTPATTPFATEASLWVAALLATVGGFLDAFTYFGHGRVFANAMTANVVLLGVAAAGGDWRQSLRHALPIAAFLGGVAIAQLPQIPRVRGAIPDPALAALSAEIVFLFAAGWYPDKLPDLPLLLGISFLAALQSSTFVRVEKWAYSSTMTTGNLRQMAEAGFRALFLDADADMLRRARLFGFICLAFLLGAATGGLCVSAWRNKALWGADVLLLVVWLPLASGWRRQPQTLPLQSS